MRNHSSWQNLSGPLGRYSFSNVGPIDIENMGREYRVSVCLRPISVVVVTPIGLNSKFVHLMTHWQLVTIALFVCLISHQPCLFVLSATSQQYFSLRTNQPPATSQQYFSLRTNQHQPSATSQTNRLYIVHNTHFKVHLIGALPYDLMKSTIFGSNCTPICNFFPGDVLHTIYVGMCKGRRRYTSIRQK
jgi:hypothetical protein